MATTFVKPGDAFVAPKESSEPQATTVGYRAVRVQGEVVETAQADSYHIRGVGGTFVTQSLPRLGSSSGLPPRQISRLH
jgi:hypothetical protein